MKLELNRIWFTPLSTGGELAIDGVPQCKTLELPNNNGLPGSCIPAGTYTVASVYSNHFGRDMPMLVDVPGRTTIEIHWGNTWHDTRGCILVGETHADNFIGNSIKAFVALWPKIDPAMMAKDCMITVVGGFTAQVAEPTLEGKV